MLLQIATRGVKCTSDLQESAADAAEYSLSNRVMCE